jgi:RHS repeat-associated protein
MFVPDALNRLSSSTLNGNSNLAVNYDAAGDITSRSDVGSYTYGNSSHPHGVTAAGSTSYTYDANGNVLTRNGLTNTWASYNLPTLLQSSVSGTTLTSQLSYGPEHQRYKQIATELNGTETTLYVGGILEKMTASTTGVTYWRHYVPTPLGTTILVSRNSDLSTTTSLILSDHLGSSDAIVNGLTGSLNVRESFSPFGLRRQSNWTAGVPSYWDQVAITESTRHGFTSHEHLDNVGLIHMNGRVYDPVTGRFLSVDPDAGNPGSSQRLNPYSYVGNRPLVATDPTGFTFPDDSLDGKMQYALQTAPNVGCVVGCIETKSGGITVPGFKGATTSADTGGSRATTAQQSAGDSGAAGTNVGSLAGTAVTVAEEGPLAEVVVTAARIAARNPEVAIGVGALYALIVAPIVVTVGPWHVKSDYPTWQLIPKTKPVENAAGDESNSSPSVDGSQSSNADPNQLEPDDQNKQAATRSRSEAFRLSKERGGIPRSAQPTRTWTERLRDQPGNVQSRVYEYVREDGSTVTIREHSLGHTEGDLGSHFNVEVRPPGGGPRQPLVGGADDHVFFGKP